MPDNSEFDEMDALNWEKALGLYTEESLDLEERKIIITRKMQHPGQVKARQHYLYLEGELQKVGFNVFVHENRFDDGSGGYETFDPGEFQAGAEQLGISELGIAELGGALEGSDYTIVANHIIEDKDSNFFLSILGGEELGISELGIAELGGGSLSRQDQLKATFFIGSESFPNKADVPLLRKNEFRELILKIKPAQTVGFLYINYI